MSYRILLLSAYDAASHRRWRTQLKAHLPRHQWTELVLPPRFFSWRLRGNPLTWVYGHKEALEAPYDLLIATSMVDLAALRGLCPRLSALPTVVYFHENQFAYPVRPPIEAREMFHLCMHNLTTALCGDRVAFNSEYNRDTFFDGGQDMLKKMPDQVPKGILEQLWPKVRVLPVPLEDACFWRRETPPTGPMSLVWNHRWEYDKGPEILFGAARLLREWGVAFRLHVVGQQFRQQPEIFEQARQELEPVLGAWGYVEQKAQYAELLRSSDIALSTALHDFQGLALLEAVAAGCWPVVPDRLAYGQWIPPSCRYPSHPESPEEESMALALHLKAHAQDLESLRQREAVDLSCLSWGRLQASYEELIEDCVVRTHPTQHSRPQQP